MDDLKEIFYEITKWHEDWNVYLDNPYLKKVPVSGALFLKHLNEKYKVSKNGSTINLE